MKPRSTSPAKLLHRHFALFLFAAALLLEFHIFRTARAAGLLAPPMPGMDQHTILQAALALPSGVLPEPGSYLYSPLYTLWLGGLAALTGGSLEAMRLLQGALAALIPVMIYRTGRRAGIGRSAAEIGAVLYLFCGSALLIALDFLRAAPLALLFLLFYYCLLGAWRSGTLRSWFLTGLCAGGCMLGRENFIAVALLPALFLFAPAVRKRLTPGNAAAAVAGCLILLAPVLLYHLVTCGSPAILPGNGANVFRFFQGEEALAAAGVLLAAGAVWSLVTPPEPRLPASERDATVRLLAELGRFSAAEHYLERARKHGAPMPAGEQFLIRALAREERHAEAQDLFRRWHKYWEQKQP